MKITALIENTCVLPGLQKEKGLSLYISTNHHKILFDSGLSDGFAQNAQKLGISLKDVDLAFISHGHSDHGRRIEEFIKLNTTSPIYIQSSTFGKYYGKKNGKYYYGGLDQKLSQNSRFVKVDGSSIINDELRIISKVAPKKEIKDLFMKKNGEFIYDTFEHEQSLVISENEKNILISGCSHTGIDQILSTAIETCGKIDYLIGGFHLIAYDFENLNDLAEIDSLGIRLLKEEVMCYTCHCTSTHGYLRLKQIMGERLGYLSTGFTISI